MVLLVHPIFTCKYTSSLSIISESKMNNFINGNLALITSGLKHNGNVSGIRQEFRLESHTWKLLLWVIAAKTADHSTNRLDYFVDSLSDLLPTRGPFICSEKIALVGKKITSKNNYMVAQLCCLSNHLNLINMHVTGFCLLTPRINQLDFWREIYSIKSIRKRILHDKNMVVKCEADSWL